MYIHVITRVHVHSIYMYVRILVVQCIIVILISEI